MTEPKGERAIETLGRLYEESWAQSRQTTQDATLFAEALASLRTAKERADEKVAELERYRAWMGEERPFIARNAELARQLHEARTAKEELEERVGTYREMWLDADAAWKAEGESSSAALAAKETAERERDTLLQAVEVRRDVVAEMSGRLSHSEAERGRLEEALNECWGEAYIGLLADDGEHPVDPLLRMRRQLDAIIVCCQQALSNQPSNQGDRG